MRASLGSISSLLPAYYSHNCASLSVMLIWLLAYYAHSVMLERCGNVNTVLLPVKSKTLITVFWNITLCSFDCRLPVTVASCTRILWCLSKMLCKAQVTQSNILLNIVFKWLVLLCIWQGPDAYLRLETGYPKVFLWFSLVSMEMPG